MKNIYVHNIVLWQSKIKLGRYILLLDISDLVRHISSGYDVEFISWLSSAQMTLRFIAVLLKMSIKMNVLKMDSCDALKNENDGDVLNETFDSITSINDESTMEELDSSCANFNDHGMRMTHDDIYAQSSTPKRGHYLPLWIQNQLYNTSRVNPSFNARDTIYGKSIGFKGQGGYYEEMCSNLSESLAVDATDFDSIDGSLDDLEMTHEERLKYRRSLDNNVIKLEEKCELLEDKNSKLRRTLNVIMKENKDLNEKLRVTEIEKSKMTRDTQELDHKIQMIIAAKRTVESSLSDVTEEKARIEKELRRIYSEIEQSEIDCNGLRRQISMKDDENESLRQQIVQMRTEIAASNAERDSLSKQADETQEKCRFAEKELEEVTKEHESMINKIQGLCRMLGKALERAEIEESPSEQRRSSHDGEATFETELFVAIENNIRIEGLVNDVKEQLVVMIGENEKSLKNSSEKGKREKLRIVEPSKVEKVCRRKGFQANRNGDTKASTLRRAKSLRSERKPTICSKEGDVVPRGSKIKELMNEKLKIENDYKELIKQNEKNEEELKTTKTQIDMLVKECGILDHQLASMRKQVGHEGKFDSEACNLSRSQESTLFLRTKEINELGETQEEMRKSLEMSQNKIGDLESELAMSKDKNSATKRHARELERKHETLKKELHHYETQSYNQNIENTRLRDHVIQLSQELSREQQRVEQLTSKLSTTKEKNATQVRKLECEMMKCVKKLDRYREREKERRQQFKRFESNTKDSSEADSGLVPDQSDEVIDLT